MKDTYEKFMDALFKAFGKDTKIDLDNRYTDLQ